MSVSYSVVQREDSDSHEVSKVVELTELESVERGRAPTFSPAVPDNAPTVMTFTNITVTTKAKKNVILDDCSGSITGGFWAIMGASGSGKTTLLSTLSLRLDSTYVDITGEFRLNGREYSRSVLKEMSAYVMQDDLLHAELTVYETLWYSAQLRMRGYSQEERLKRIDEVLVLMGIDHCRDVIIGDTRKKGISGGERKRVSVAIELLNHPKLLFLDEPTSGLDSTTAFSVTKALKHLTAIGECTVLCTIHQPMPKIFRLFDNLILMKKGKIVYQGQAMKSLKWLDVIGSPCPKSANLADHLLNVVSPTSEDYGEKVDHNTAFTHLPVDLTLGMLDFD
jgi:ABC-type multidrug transport system ATPase subunit